MRTTLEIKNISKDNQPSKERYVPLIYCTFCSNPATNMVGTGIGYMSMCDDCMKKLGNMLIKNSK